MNPDRTLRPVPDDPALASLEELCDAVRRSIRDAEQVLTRAEVIRSQRAQGMAHRDVAPTEAKALHDEGLSMDRIAEHFGVTRQRVSALLRAAENRPPRPAETSATSDVSISPPRSSTGPDTRPRHTTPA